MQDGVWALLLLLCCGLCCFTSGSVVSLPVFGLPSFVEFPCVVRFSSFLCYFVADAILVVPFLLIFRSRACVQLVAF